MGADTGAGSEPGGGARIGGRAGDGDGLSSGVRARACSCSGAGLFERQPALVWSWHWLQLNSCFRAGTSLWMGHVLALQGAPALELTSEPVLAPQLVQDVVLEMPWLCPPHLLCPAAVAEMLPPWP